MTERPHSPDDESVLAELRDALGFNDVVPEGTLDMVMTGFDIVNLDVVLADLLHDTAAGSLALRSEDREVRHMVFESGGHRVSIEIGPRAPHVVGRVDPPPVGAVELDQPAPPSLVATEGGRFEFTINPTMPFRLRWTTTSGVMTATDWIE